MADLIPSFAAHVSHSCSLLQSLNLYVYVGDFLQRTLIEVRPT